jgi:hypothetical protein
MFGHVAERRDSSRLISSILLAIALAWSFAMRDDAARSRIGVGTLLAVAVASSGLRVGIMLIGRRRRRERKAERHAEDGAAETDGETPTEEYRPTYEEIFGSSVASEGPSDHGDDVDGRDADPNGEFAAGDGHDAPGADLQGSDGEGPWMSDDVEAEHAENDDVEAEHTETADGEAAWISDEVDAQAEAEGAQEQGEASDGEVEEQGEAFEGEVEEPDVDVEAIRSELESEEAIRRLREEFKARAREAELRIQQRQAELDQAPSAPTSA